MVRFSSLFSVCCSALHQVLRLVLRARCSPRRERSHQAAAGRSSRRPAGSAGHPQLRPVEGTRECVRRRRGLRCVRVHAPIRSAAHTVSDGRRGRANCPIANLRPLAFLLPLLTGLPDETCQAYTAQAKHRDPLRCDASDICMNCMPTLRNESLTTCWSVDPPILYYVKEYGTLAGEQAIMNEVYERGSEAERMGRERAGWRTRRKRGAIRLHAHSFRPSFPLAHALSSSFLVLFLVPPPPPVRSRARSRRRTTSTTTTSAASTPTTRTPATPTTTSRSSGGDGTRPRAGSTGRRGTRVRTTQERRRRGHLGRRAI